MGSTPSITSHPFRLAGAALVAVALLGACSASDDASTSLHVADPMEAPAAETGAFDTDMDDMDDMAAEAPASGSSVSPADGVGGFDLGEIGREVAVEMRIAMRSDDLRATVDGILAAASAGGGGVAATDIDYGTETRDGRATVIVKVPPRSLNALLSGLDELGEIVSIGQDAQDVTDQLTDLDVRIRNAEQSVDRVRGLLTEATDLREVIDLESELTRRQTDLERLQASQRNLQDRVALATVTIQVFPTSTPVIEESDTDPGIRDGFRTGWEAFVGVLFGLVYGLAVIAPLLAVALVVLVIGWRVARARSRRLAAAARPAPPAPSDTTATAPDRDDADSDLIDAGSTTRPM